MKLLQDLPILYIGTQPLLLKLLSSQGIWSCVLGQRQATVTLMGKSTAPDGNLLNFFLK